MLFLILSLKINIMKTRRNTKYTELFKVLKDIEKLTLLFTKKVN